MMAGPVSYAVGGEQYVAVSVGWGEAFAAAGAAAHHFAPEHNRPRVLAFKLDGDAVLPAPTPLLERRALQQPVDDASPDAIVEGQSHYYRHCAPCHGGGAEAGTLMPDLRYSPTLGDSGLWNTIVYTGALSHRGMIGFSGTLTRDEIEAVRAFVVRQAHLAHQAASRE